MPVMNNVEARTPLGRLFLGIIYLLVILGGLTMVYPFCIMLSGSISSGVDIKEFKIIPRYLYNDDVLFLKTGEEKYAGKQKFNVTEHLNRNWGTEFSALENMPEEAEKKEFFKHLSAIPPEGLKNRAADWKAFSETVPADFRIRCMDGVQLHEFKVFLAKKYPDSDSIQRTLKIAPVNIVLPFEDPYRRNWKRPQTPFYREYQNYLASREKCDSVPLLMDNEFVRQLQLRYGSIGKFNRAAGTSCKNFQEITLAKKSPAGLLGQEWQRYVLKSLPLPMMKLQIPQKKYTAFLKVNFRNVRVFNKRFGTSYASLDEISPPVSGSSTGEAVDNLLKEYLLKHGDAGEITVHTPDTEFRDAMKRKYDGKIENLNRAWKSAFSSFDEVKAPLLESDYHDFLQNKFRWKTFFLFHNYAVVWRYIAIQGRALWNTLILCFFSVLAALTVNPMCAYALSRYRMKHKYAVLMFFIATMAFPGMVLMIPNFVLLKELNLLNTYWALILPHMASGYYIFMMKGFFDSLPRELYEAATIDGANEFVIFTRITLPLIKPIMAVKGLAAFTAAYSGFMWAFIICQDQSMWTIAVYLYQFQMNNSQHLVMASLVLASLPLLLIFIFCQKIIMKGIIIPVMK